MPHDRPAPQTRIADDDTQDDWAADLFVALDEQSAQGESDDGVTGARRWNTPGADASLPLA